MSIVGVNEIFWLTTQLIRYNTWIFSPANTLVPVKLMEGESEHAAYAENGFNIKVSDRVSLDRSLKVC